MFRPVAEISDDAIHDQPSSPPPTYEQTIDQAFLQPADQHVQLRILEPMETGEPYRSRSSSEESEPRNAKEMVTRSWARLGRAHTCVCARESRLLQAATTYTVSGEKQTRLNLYPKAATQTKVEAREFDVHQIYDHDGTNVAISEDFLVNAITVFYGHDVAIITIGSILSNITNTLFGMPDDMAYKSV
jgi:hypothetical protein